MCWCNESMFYLQDVVGNYIDSCYVGMEDYCFSQWCVMVEGKVCMGQFSYQIVFGVLWQKQVNDYLVNSVFVLFGVGNFYVLNLYCYESLYGFIQYCMSEIVQKLLFVSDIVQLIECWLVLVGVCYMNYVQCVFQVSGVEDFGYCQNGVVMLIFVVMFKFVLMIIVYVSYVELFEFGSCVNDVYVNVGQVFKLLCSK